MMTPRQSLEAIAKLLERAMEPDADPRDVRCLIASAHTHAIIQASSQRRVEARATFAAYPQLEQGPMQ